MKTPLLIVIGLLMILTGCGGYGGGPYYGDGYYYDNGAPDVYLFGGGYENGRDVRNYSHRGSGSRGAAHSGGSHGTAHAGGSHGAAHAGGGRRR